MAEYIIEIDAPRNRNVQFAPRKATLRGRWKASLVATKSSTDALREVSQIEFIPGLCIAVDDKARRLRVFDPLNTTKEGKEIWASLLPILENHSAVFPVSRPADEVVHENASYNEIKTWLHAMRSFVDAGYARIAEGSMPLPDKATIARMKGGREIEAYDSSSNGVRLADVVPVGAA